jgi:hypothetical protein
MPPTGGGGVNQRTILGFVEMELGLDDHTSLALETEKRESSSALPSPATLSAVARRRRARDEGSGGPPLHAQLHGRVVEERGEVAHRLGPEAEGDEVGEKLGGAGEETELGLGVEGDLGGGGWNGREKKWRMRRPLEWDVFGWRFI